MAALHAHSLVEQKCEPSNRKQKVVGLKDFARILDLYNLNRRRIATLMRLQRWSRKNTPQMKSHV